MSSAVVPRPLLATVVVVGAQVLALVVLAVLQLLNLHQDKVAMGLTTTAFFLIFALALVVCARGLIRLDSWARSPIVLFELITLGVAWSFHGTPAVAIPLALTAIVGLVGIFAPASLHALEPVGD